MKMTLYLVFSGLAIFPLAAQDLSVVFPALKILPAPPSIEEGMRLSYYGSVGDIPNADFNKWGGELGQWDYATAPSGHGYTQADVVSLSQGVAALTVQAWQYANWTGPLVPVRGGQSAFVGYAGGGDWWVHPEVLAQIQDLQAEGLTVIRITQVLDGKAYPAIRFQRVTETSRQATVYDLSTGLLLFKNTAVQTGSSTFASQMFYRGTRRLPSAGHPAPIPLWIRPGLQLAYKGTFTPIVAGNPSGSLAVEALDQIQAVGDGWFLYEQTTTLASVMGMPPSVEKATLLGGGTFYVDPEHLKTFRKGAVLDTDPITGCQLVVADTGTTITLQAIVGTVSMTEFRLDASCGLMTGFRSWDSTDPILQTTSEVELTQWPDFTAVRPPTLRITQRGQKMVLSCPAGADRPYWIERCVNGGAWDAAGHIAGQAEWEMPIDYGLRCILFRLRQ